MKRRVVFLILTLVFAGAAFLIYHLAKNGKRDSREPADTSIVEGLRLLINYEDSLMLNNFHSLNAEQAFSGKYSAGINAELEFGSCFEAPVSKIPDFDNVRRIEVSAMFFSEEGGEGKFVVEINSTEGKNLYWMGQPFTAAETGWQPLNFIFPIDSIDSLAGTIKIYPWNTSKKTTYIDDVEIVFYMEEPVVKKQTQTRNFFYSFDDAKDNEYTISDDKAYSGQRSMLLDVSDDYSDKFCINADSISNDTLKIVSASVRINPDLDNPDFSLVLEISDQNNKQLYWTEKSTKNMNFAAGKWSKLNAYFPIPEENYRNFSGTDNVCIYIWKRKNGRLHIDDLRIVYGSEPPRPGNPPLLDLQERPGKYEFDRLKPPYRSIYLNYKSEISIAGSKESLAFKPGDTFIAGNFINDGKDEIIRLSEEYVELFSFNESLNNFDMKRFEFPITDRNKSSVFRGKISAGVSDVFFILNHESKLLRAYSINDKINLVGEFDLSKLISFNPVSYAAADFNNDGLTEMIAMDNTGMYVILNMADGGSLLSSGRLDIQSESEVRSMQAGYLLPGSRTCQALVNFVDKGIMKSSLYDFNSGMKKFARSSRINSQQASMFIGGKLFAGDFDGDESSELLIFREDERFELKYVDADMEGIYLKGVLDFKGYKEDRNPKYYERAEIVPGKFFRSDSSSLLVILYNCKDAAFPCKVFENRSQLPNSIHFYSFPDSQ